jgi:hypothetical protein
MNFEHYFGGGAVPVGPGAIVDLPELLDSSSESSSGAGYPRTPTALLLSERKSNIHRILVFRS